MKPIVRAWGRLIARVAYIAFFGVSLASPAGADGINSGACALALRELVETNVSGYQDLTREQRAFLSEVMLPVTGKRTLFEGPNQVRTCTAWEQCILLPGKDGQKSLRVQWQRDISTPVIESSASEKILSLPVGYDFSELPDNGKSLLLNWLHGHDLHPYIASAAAKAERVALGEPSLLLKEVQKDAIDAAARSLARGDRKFLYVSPTGSGKTEVLMSVLKERLAESSAKLHVLMADQNFLVQQLAEDVAELQARGARFKLIQWGGDHGATSLEELLKQVETSEVPVILATSIQSFKARVKTPAAYEKVRPILGTLVYDEVHHAGADQAKKLVQELIDHRSSKAVFCGTSATPVHRSTNIMELFGNQAFWAYLDTPQTFLSSSHAAERSVDDVVLQLSRAIEAGELTPVEAFSLLDTKSIVKKGDALFQQANGNRWMLNPEYDGSIAEKLLPYFRTHEYGFVTAGTIAEAERLTKAFAKAMGDKTPPRSFAVLHSNLPAKTRRKIFEDAKAGKINYLVTVGMLDEGINLPRMQLFVDLNKSAGSRQLLQRLGRTLRLYPRKEGVDVVSIMEISEENLREKIKLLDQIEQGKLGSRARRTGDSARPAFEEDSLVAIRKIRRQLMMLDEEQRSLVDRMNEYIKLNGAAPDGKLHSAFYQARYRNSGIFQELERDTQSFVWDWWRYKKASLAEQLDAFVEEVGIPRAGLSSEEKGLRERLIMALRLDPRFPEQLSPRTIRDLRQDSELAKLLPVYRRKREVAGLRMENVDRINALAAEGKLPYSQRTFPDGEPNPDQKTYQALLYMFREGSLRVKYFSPEAIALIKEQRFYKNFKTSFLDEMADFQRRFPGQSPPPESPLGLRKSMYEILGDSE